MQFLVEQEEEEEEEELRNLWAEVRELSLGTTTGIDRLCFPPPPLHFLRHYVSQNKPCIISNAITHWPALSKWTQNSYLSKTLSSSTISLHLTPNGRADALTPIPHNSSKKSHLCFAAAHVHKLPFPQALDHITNNNNNVHHHQVVGYGQEQNNCLVTEYSEISGDVEEEVGWASEAFGVGRPEAVNLWVGNERSQSWFHKDHYENMYAVVTGEKEFLLLPPTDVHRMYVKDYPAANYCFDQDKGEFKLELEEPTRYVKWCSVDPYPETQAAMEEQKRLYPRYFNGPEPYSCTVRAGEMLYLPSMWFHHVRQTPDAQGKTIAVNYWYDMQFDIKYAYFNFLQSCIKSTQTQQPR